jgi:hypothetical protein
MYRTWETVCGKHMVSHINLYNDITQDVVKVDCPECLKQISQQEKTK